MRIDKKNVPRILMYLLLALLPVQLGTFFFFSFSYVSGVKIDYLAPALYLTDIIALLLIMCHPSAIKKNLPLPLLLFLGLILINISLSFSPYLGLYRLAKLIEVGAIFLVTKTIIHLDYKKILMIVLGSSLVQLLISTFQMIRGESLQGIWYFLGERNFSISTASIAKVSLDGTEILRPYGTFSHPNSLAGFFLLFYTFILFSKEFDKYKKLKYLTLGVMSLLIFLSFSKIAIFTYLLVTIYYAVRAMKKICWICTISKIAIATIIAFLFLQAKGDPNTINKRIYLIQSSFRILADEALLGTGLGNYLYAQSAIPNPYPYHFLEPVHNIVLLSLTELGIPLFLFGLYLLVKYSKYWLQDDAARALVIVILLTGMFDHYWLTLQQNILLLPVLFGLLQNGAGYDKINGTKDY